VIPGCGKGPILSYPVRTLWAMENSNRQLTAIEALFAGAGLPAVEVEACPVPDCAVCRATLPKAA